jgi:hypothetical protein
MLYNIKSYASYFVDHHQLANKALSGLKFFDGSQDNGDTILLFDGKKMTHFTGIDRTANEETALNSRDRNTGWGFSKGF